ncbi:MAG: FAD-dependent oxidoreductase [Prolixibacteraceae bacterium]|jgi:hypothetical protein|nr:FAD-dependent oxidoreductase [Prolixibacteraceae bacterium]
MERREFIRIGGIGTLLSSTILPASGESYKSESDHVKKENLFTPVKGKFDVIVCGGGPAGVVAAIEAGRSGAKTMLIEANGCLGGVWTSGLLTWIIDYQNKSGLLNEILHELRKRGAECSIDIEGAYSFDPESMKLLLEEFCIEAGVTIRFHTRVCNAITENYRLTHAITESKSGREAWNASIFIDATGDGDLAALSGCGFDFGDTANNGLTQPFSLLAIIGGVNFDDIKDYSLWSGIGMAESKKNLLTAIQNGGFEPSYRSPSIHPISNNLFKIMANHEYGYSAINADDVSKATLIGRKEVWQTVEALKNNGGIWENIRIISTAEQIGTREGRRIHGLYTVTVQDVIEGRRHKDSVCRASFGFDVHALTKLHSENSHNYKGFLKSQPYDIPLRALIAKDVNGLMLAGRCISGDFLPHASYRVTGNAAEMGFAAGRVAAISARLNKLPQEVIFSEFQL